MARPFIAFSGIPPAAADWKFRLRSLSCKYPLRHRLNFTVISPSLANLSLCELLTAPSAAPAVSTHCFSKPRGSYSLIWCSANWNRRKTAPPSTFSTEPSRNTAQPSGLGLVRSMTPPTTQVPSA